MKHLYLSIFIPVLGLVSCGGGGGGSADAALVAQVVPKGYTETVFEDFEAKIIGGGSISIKMADLSFTQWEEGTQAGDFSVTYTVEQATSIGSKVLMHGSIEGTWSTPIAGDRNIIIQKAEGENGNESLQIIGARLQVNEVHKDPLSSVCTFVDGSIQIRDKDDTDFPYSFNLSGTKTKLNYKAK